MPTCGTIRAREDHILLVPGLIETLLGNTPKVDDAERTKRSTLLRRRLVPEGA